MNGRGFWPHFAQKFGPFGRWAIFTIFSQKSNNSLALWYNLVSPKTPIFQETQKTVGVFKSKFEDHFALLKLNEIISRWSNYQLCYFCKKKKSMIPTLRGYVIRPTN